jgi:hypothetical protein
MGVVDSEMMVVACAGDWVDGVVVAVAVAAAAAVAAELAVVWEVAGACPETIALAPADIRTRKAVSAVVVEEMDSEASAAAAADVAVDLPESDFAVVAAVEKTFLFCFAPDGKINGGACSPREQSIQHKCRKCRQRNSSDFLFNLGTVCSAHLALHAKRNTVHRCSIVSASCVGRLCCVVGLTFKNQQQQCEKKEKVYDFRHDNDNNT